MQKNVDILIVGAGFSGCVIAERAARELGCKVLVVDRRNHIGGNCFDDFDENGVLVHKYGPHYFRTNNEELVGYLSNFTSWIPGNYIVKSVYNDQLFPFPINIDTLEQFFQTTLNPSTARELLYRKRIDIPQPANSEEFVLSRVGQKLYEAFYLNYTLKQWGKHPRELDSSVCGRIPVRFNRDNRYVDHKFQLMPTDGYTTMFTKMIDHPNIHLSLNTDYRELNISDIPVLVYTGAVDEYFDFCYGHLPWRSLSFKYENLEQEIVQPCVQINYPNEHDYTRSVEIKHVTGQKHPNTTVVYEYPTSKGEPYYPVPAPENRKLYERYKALACKEAEEKNVFFTGRLAEYAYLNMDEVIERSLEIFKNITLRLTRKIEKEL